MRYGKKLIAEWILTCMLAMTLTEVSYAGRKFVCEPALNQHNILLADLQSEESSQELQLKALRTELALPESQRTNKDPRWFSFLRRGNSNPVTVELQNQIEEVTLSLLRTRERLAMLRRYASISRELSYLADNHPEFQTELAKKYVEFNNGILKRVFSLVENPTTDGKILGSAYGVLSEIERGVSDISSGNMDEAAKVYRKLFDWKKMILGTLLKKQYFKLFGRSRPLAEESRQQIVQIAYAMDLETTEGVLNRYIEIRRKVERIFPGKVTESDLIAFLMLSYSTNVDIDAVWHAILGQLRHMEQLFGSQREIPLGAAVKFAEIAIQTKDAMQVIRRMKDIAEIDKQESKSHRRRKLSPLAIALIIDASFKVSSDVISPHLYIYSNYQDIENHLYWLHDRKIETDELALVTLGVVLSKAMVKTGTEQKQAQLAVMNGINQTLKSISDEEGRFFNRTLTLSELARLVRICYEISAAPHDLTRFHLSMKDLFKDQIPVSVLAQLGRVFKVQYQKRSGLQGNVPNLTRLTREQLAGLLYRPESMAISISDYLMDQKFISEMQKNEEAPSPGILSRLMVTAFGEEESTPTLSHTEASRRNLDRMFEKIYFSSNGAK